MNLFSRQVESIRWPARLTVAGMATALFFLVGLNARTAKAADATSPVLFLDQGWGVTAKDREKNDDYYFRDQGSRVLPLAWFLSLERADNNGMFADPDYLRTFGWLFQDRRSDDNPYNLPIGFSVTGKKMINPAYPSIRGTSWVGLNCAACHTGDLTYKGRRVRIDGGVPTIEYDKFHDALALALKSTAQIPDKFDRFEKRVHGRGESVENLKSALTEFAGKFAIRARLQTSPLEQGPGRLDAVTWIINDLSVMQLGIPENYLLPDAPVSYPHLWYAPDLDFVQWAPLAANPIARNAGEVLGVHGNAYLNLSKADQLGLKVAMKIKLAADRLHRFDTSEIETKESLIKRIFSDGKKVVTRVKGAIAPETKKRGLLQSTIQFSNLRSIEDWLRELKPPPWREDLFGKINTEKARRGMTIFNKRCAGCHNMPPFRMTEPVENPWRKQFISIGRVKYTDVGTDPRYIENLTGRTIESGPLKAIFESQKVKFIGKSRVHAADFFVYTVGAITKIGLKNLGLSDAEKIKYSNYRFAAIKPELIPVIPPSKDDLKAGHLMGIWATGPFLHNGSVPNIYEILLPPEKRSKEFWVGSREFDPEKLGFVSTKADGLFRFDTTLAGNRNTGHHYGTEGGRALTDADRYAIIEYLKDPVRVLKDRRWADERRLTLESRLSQKDRRNFYHRSLGSMMMPVNILKALTDQDAGLPFLQSIERFGFLHDTDQENGDGLPIGMSVTAPGDNGVKFRMAGLNCAVCHVGELHHEGRVVRIDGAPNPVNIEGMAKALISSIKATLKDPRSLSRFIRRIEALRAEDKAAGRTVEAVHKQTDEQHKQGLRATIERIEQKILVFKKMAKVKELKGPGTDTGPGRSDTWALGRNMLFDERDWVAPTAPASFPDLWSHHPGDNLGWNGGTRSGMERGIATVIGLGAQFDPKDNSSSVSIENLVLADQLAYRISPPKWPEDVFGAIDSEKAKAGEAIFKESCATCHKAKGRTLVPISKVGTDPVHARNFARRMADGRAFSQALSDDMESYKLSAYKSQRISSERRKEIEAPAIDIWRTEEKDLFNYAARSLAGAWATAPFLHNGSVPTLYHLLLPPDQRPKSFPVGHRNYDPKRLGYRTKTRPCKSSVASASQSSAMPAACWAETSPRHEIRVPEGLWKFDVTETGNGNQGHPFGTDLNETQRMELLEYLKTL